ncbi:MAG: hypothetical protein ACYDIA_00375, partial [Candidatus Humimicrobiaceae bacterium]
KHEFGWDLKISIPAGEYPGHRGLTEMWFNVRDESIKNVPDDSHGKISTRVKIFFIYLFLFILYNKIPKIFYN